MVLETRELMLFKNLQYLKNGWLMIINMWIKVFFINICKNTKQNEKNLDWFSH